MKVVNPYLSFNGNTEEAFTFYKSVFGGEFSTLMRMKDAAGMPVPEGQEEKIMHIALPLNCGQMLMGSDNCNDTSFIKGNNFYVSIHTNSIEEGKKLFEALSAGGKPTHDFKKEFWGDWFGQLTDQYGINWMINYTERQQ